MTPKSAQARKSRHKHVRFGGRVRVGGVGVGASHDHHGRLLINGTTKKNMGIYLPPPPPLPAIADALVKDIDLCGCLGENHIKC